MSIDHNEVLPLSSAQKEYLQGRVRYDWFIRLMQFGILFALLILWEVAAQMEWIDPFLLSSPSRMMRSLLQLTSSGELLLHLGTTLLETAIGFFLGGLLGVLIAILLWWSETLNRILDPYLVVINSLPKIALGPVLIVWIGAGMKAIIAMALLVSVVVTLVTVLSGFREIAPEKITLLKSFGATRSQILRMVVLPGSVPAMISALKLNIGMTWVGVIVGEFLVSRAGLGYLIVYGGQVFKLDLVMAATALLCVFAAVMYFGIAAIEAQVRRRREG